MSSITLYHYPKCTSSRKARQLLDELGADVVERRYFTDLPTEDEIRALAELLPGGVRDILSTRSRRYREMNLADKQVTDEELVQLLATEPGLWRRPIAIKGETAVVGYNEEVLRALVG